MSLTFLPSELVIESDASITDLPAFHAALRDWEDGEGAAIYPVTHTYKVIDLGGGAFFPAVALINGWRLRFPVAGSYIITGNLKGDVLLGAGVALERQTSAAYATTSIGSGGLPPDQVALLEAIARNTGLIPALL